MLSSLSIARMNFLELLRATISSAKNSIQCDKLTLNCRLLLIQFWISNFFIRSDKMRQKSTDLSFLFTAKQEKYHARAMTLPLNRIWKKNPISNSHTPKTNNTVYWTPDFSARLTMSILMNATSSRIT